VPVRLKIGYLPDPFDFFQNSPATSQGDVKRGKSPAKPGDKIVLRELMDVIAIDSACPQDLIDLNGFNVTDINLIVREG
jgi:uncharacterized protein YcgI (DUF1989 family)